MKPTPQNKAVTPRAAWRSWYKDRRWHAIRAKRKKAEPWCRFCAAAGKRVPMHSVDHITPHRGDARLFFDYHNTQSLCEYCHNSVKQGIEARGYDTAVGPDGLPSDPNHPFNS